MKVSKTLVLLSIFAFAAGLVACSDDDSSNNNQAVCGNGQVEGDEVCDQTNLNSQTCTSIPGGFTGGDLSCSGTCTFITTACTTGQEECGNDTLEAGEDCDGSDLGTATCETVGNYTGGTLGCTGLCAFDTSQCEAPANCGNGDIDTGEECDGTNLNSNDCTTIGGSYTGGTLTCNGDCSFNETQCTTVGPDCGNGTVDTGEECDGTDLNNQTCADVGPYQAGQGSLTCDGTCHFVTTACVPTTAGEIQAVVDAGDATSLTLPITGAWVTYITPGMGNLTNDPAGFTLQSEQGGPAIFVAVDPATLTPVPVVGDEVSLTVTDTELALGGGQPRVIGITSFTRASQGNDVPSLVQDVSASTDLVSALDDYTSELITATVTITGTFASAGTGFVSAEVTTTGVTAAPLPKLRIPGPMRQALGLDTGCTLTVTQTPLWRYADEAQIAAWVDTEITGITCDPPQVLSALATAADTVVVTFNRELTDTSVLANGSQFTISDGTNPLAVTAASVTAPDQVTLTTATQTGAVTYTVTVAVTVQDIFGVGVDQTANTADFLGFETFGAQLYLWEMDTDQVGSPDPEEFVEIWNNTGASVDFTTEKYYLLFLNGGNTDDGVYVAIRLLGTMLPDDLLVVGKAAVPNVDLIITADMQQGADGILLVRCDTCDDNADSEFPLDFDVGTSPTFTSTLGETVTKIDGIAYDTNDNDDTVLMSKLGVTAQWNEAEGGSSTTQSLQRTGVNSWVTGTPTPGTL